MARDQPLFDAKALMDFGNAYVISSARNAHTEDAIITLRWKVAAGAAEECRTWLDENRRVITSDFEVDAKPYKAPFRSVLVTTKGINGEERSGAYIEQTLAFGWVTTLLDGAALDYTSARLIDDRELTTGSVAGTDLLDSSDNPEQYLLLRYEGVDPTKVDTVVKQVRALTPNTYAPVVNGETMGTGYYLLLSRGYIRQEGTEDRSGVVDILLAKPRFNLETWESRGTPAELRHFRLYNVPKYVAQSVINTYNKDVTGSTASAGGLTDTGLVTIDVTEGLSTTTAAHVAETSCAFFTQTTFYYNRVELPNVSTNSMGVTYDSRFAVNRRTGYWEGWISKKHRGTIAIPAYTTDDQLGRSVTHEGWDGLYGPYSGTFRSATLSISGTSVSTDFSNVVLPSATLDNGQRREIKEQRNTDCTYGIDVLTHDVTELFHEGGVNASGLSATIRNIRHADASWTGGAASIGTYHSWEGRRTDDGSYDEGRRSSTVQDLSYEEDAEAVGRTQSISGTLQALTSATLSGSTPIGQTRRTQNRRDKQHGAYDIEAISSTVLPLAYSEDIRGTGQVVSVSGTLQSSTPATASSPSIGIIQRSTNRRNPEHGAYDMENISTTHNPLTYAEQVVGLGRERAVSGTLQSTVSASVTATPGIGQVLSAANRRDKVHGAYDIEEVSATVNPLTYEENTESRGEITQVSGTLQAGTSATISGTADIGETLSTRNRRNPEHGAYDIENISVTSRPLSSTYIDGGQLWTHSKTEFSGQTTVPIIAVGDIGVITDVDARLNADATLRGLAQSTTSSTALSATFKYVTNDNHSRVSRLFKNYHAIPPWSGTLGGVTAHYERDKTLSGQIDDIVITDNNGELLPWAWGEKATTSEGIFYERGRAQGSFMLRSATFEYRLIETDSYGKAYGNLEGADWGLRCGQPHVQAYMFQNRVYYRSAWYKVLVRGPWAVDNPS